MGQGGKSRSCNCFRRPKSNVDAQSSPRRLLLDVASVASSDFDVDSNIFHSCAVSYNGENVASDTGTGIKDPIWGGTAYFPNYPPKSAKDILPHLPKRLKMFGADKLEPISEKQVDNIIAKYRPYFEHEIDAINVALVEVCTICGWSHCKNTLRNTPYKGKRGSLQEKNVLGGFAMRNTVDKNGVTSFVPESDFKKNQLLAGEISDTVPKFTFNETGEPVINGFKSVHIRLDLPGRCHGTAYAGWGVGRKGFTGHYTDIFVKGGRLDGILPEKTQFLPDFLIGFFMKGFAARRPTDTTAFLLGMFVTTLMNTKKIGPGNIDALYGTIHLENDAPVPSPAEAREDPLLRPTNMLQNIF